MHLDVYRLEDYYIGLHNTWLYYGEFIIRFIIYL